jgi:DNA-binding response OmpR family regulator
MIKILLAEDDMDFGSILKKYLEMNNFKVFHITNGEDAWRFFKENKPDFCILDIMMPKTNGYTLAKRIRKQSPDMPFLFLTAKQQKEDVLKGLKAGADDYMTKPFEAEELILRIKNILKRTKTNMLEEYKIGAYVFTPASLELSINNIKINMTVLEADLLTLLLTNKNKIIKKEIILKELWGVADYFTARSMDVFISRLRKYLSKDSRIEIKTFRGKGLMLFCK